MNLVKIYSTVIDSLKRRIPKFLRYGLRDVQTAQVVAPWGIDSHPIKNAIAAFSETSDKGSPIILGYINVSKKVEVGTEDHAAIGELRLYSTNAAGEQKIYLWLKNDGTMELGGSTRNVVKYQELDAGLQQMATDINVELTKISVVLNGLVPGSYTPVPIVPEISSAKSNNVKL